MYLNCLEETSTKPEKGESQQINRTVLQLKKDFSPHQQTTINITATNTLSEQLAREICALLAFPDGVDNKIDQDLFFIFILGEVINKTCSANGRTYNVGDRFKIECNFCSCGENGSIACTRMLCRPRGEYHWNIGAFRNVFLHCYLLGYGQKQKKMLLSFNQNYLNFIFD